MKTVIHLLVILVVSVIVALILSQYGEGSIFCMGFEDRPSVCNALDSIFVNFWSIPLVPLLVIFVTFMHLVIFVTLFPFLSPFLEAVVNFAKAMLGFPLFFYGVPVFGTLTLIYLTVLLIKKYAKSPYRI